MKTSKFIPSVCKETVKEDGEKLPAKFKGCIVLKVPNYFERQKFQAILMESITADGETDVNTIKEDLKKTGIVSLMQRMEKMVRESEPFYQSVELENVETGVFHKSFEDLTYDKDAEVILQEVSNELASGFALSKNS